MFALRAVAGCTLVGLALLFAWAWGASGLVSHIPIPLSTATATPLATASRSSTPAPSLLALPCGKKGVDDPPPPTTLLKPLEGRTLLLMGDSTTREPSIALRACLGDVLPTLGLPFIEVHFVRQLLASRTGPSRCGTGKRVPLATALSNATSFAEYAGDALVLGVGLWHLQRDHAQNTQENYGHAKYGTAAGIIDNYAAELDTLLLALAALPEPWRSQLRQRLWWREITSTEEVIAGNPDLWHEGRAPMSVAAANCRATPKWEAAGFRVLRFHQYSVVNASAGWAAVPPPRAFTRDGTHLSHGPGQMLMRRLLTELVDAERDWGALPLRCG